MANNPAEGNHATLAKMEHLRKESLNLYWRYLLTRDLDDIHQAVHCAREHLAHVYPYASMICHLGRTLLRRFQHTRQVEDLTDAFEHFRRTFPLLRGDTILLQKCFGYLSIAYLERDGNREKLLDMSAPDAYSQSRPSLETLTQNLGEDDEVFMYVVNTTDDLESRYASQSKVEDLDTAIQVCRRALGFFSSNPDRRSEIMLTLGRILKRRFRKHNNDIEVINEAVECFDVGLELQLQLSKSTAKSFLGWQSLASEAYVQRFLALGRRQDLDNAVHLAKRAVEVAETQYPNVAQDPKFAACLVSLSDALLAQYDITKDVNDLDAAMEASCRAVAIAEDPYILESLSVCLRYRYGRSRQAEDLIDLIATTQKAIDGLPQNHPGLVSLLSHLCNFEYEQFLVLQDQKYLDRAMQHLQQAWRVREGIPGLRHELQSDLLYVTGNFLDIFGVDCVRDILDVTWFGGELGSATDVTMEFARAGASLSNDPLAKNSHFNVCRLLFQRWQATKEQQDLDEAISIARRAVELAEGLPDQALIARQNLGLYLYNRFASTGDDYDREEALALVREGFQMSGAAPPLRMSVGKLAIEILSDTGDWDRARKLSQEVVPLFVIMNGRSQAWPEKQHLLREFSRCAAPFASIALEAGSNVLDVIDMLEACRGSILGHLIDKRTDLDDLLEAAPEMAELFQTLRDEVNTVVVPSTDINSRVKQTRRRIEAEGEFLACLEKIRMQEGFQRFLLGPTERELKAAAARGPILVVNVTRHRSDAIIITKDALNLLPLPGLNYWKVLEYIDADLTDFDFKDIGRKNRKFRQLQEWLWDNCVKLIFVRLRDFGYGPAKFRVWWMGVGVANFLPFHAAGKYGRNSGETALSLAISSYALTFKILTHSHRNVKDDPLESALRLVTIGQRKPRLTLITMPSTPGKSDLDGVRLEAEEVQKIVGDNYSTQIVVQPNGKDTMARMAECEIVHFACHGESTILDPSCSHLLLQATPPNSTTPEVDKLRLKDVVEADLGHGKLAFLSACSTAQSRDQALRDEVLHLVSGFHVAGYLHAIGNLWPSDDERSVELVKGFYTQLVATGEFGTGHNVAKALNEALLGMAEKYAREPLSWAQFVHFGI